MTIINALGISSTKSVNPSRMFPLAWVEIRAYIALRDLATGFLSISLYWLNT